MIMGLPYKNELNDIMVAVTEVRHKVETDNLGVNQSLTAINDRLSAIMTQINDFGARMERMEKQLSRMQAPKPSSTPISNDSRVYDKLQKNSPKHESKPKPELKIQSRQFYAVMVGSGSLELYEMEDTDKDLAPFLATVTGNKGTVEFNYSCVSTLLPRASADLLPFFEYDLQYNPPTSIEAVNKANITFDGEKWIMDKPIKIIIT